MGPGVTNGHRDERLECQPSITVEAANVESPVERVVAVAEGGLRGSTLRPDRDLIEIEAWGTGEADTPSRTRGHRQWDPSLT